MSRPTVYVSYRGHFPECFEPLIREFEVDFYEGKELGTPRKEFLKRIRGKIELNVKFVNLALIAHFFILGYIFNLK